MCKDPVHSLQVLWTSVEGEQRGEVTSKNVSIIRCKKMYAYLYLAVPKALLVEAKMLTAAATFILNQKVGKKFKEKKRQKKGLANYTNTCKH